MKDGAVKLEILAYHEIDVETELVVPGKDVAGLEYHRCRLPGVLSLAFHDFLRVGVEQMIPPLAPGTCPVGPKTQIVAAIATPAGSGAEPGGHLVRADHGDTGRERVRCGIDPGHSVRRLVGTFTVAFTPRPDERHVHAVQRRIPVEARAELADNPPP